MGTSKKLMKFSDSCKFLSFQRDKSRLIHSLFVLFFAILITYTWQRNFKMSSSKRLSPADPNSYARPDIAKVTHIHLNLDLNFDDKILEGSAILTIEKVQADAE